MKKPPVIIQGRMGSVRLPGKVLAQLAGKTVLEYVVHRCRLSQAIGGVMLATTTRSEDDALTASGRSLGLEVFRGSESDVLERYIGAARAFGSETLIRITADCPLIDPDAIDAVVQLYDSEPSDYVHVEGYPNGLGSAELMTLSALRRARDATSVSDIYYREHVMTYLTDHPDQFRLLVRRGPQNVYRPDLRLSVDDPADLEVVRAVCSHFGPRMEFRSAEIIRFLDEHPEIRALNQHVQQKTR